MALRERLGRETSRRLRFSTADHSNPQKRGSKDKQVGQDAGKQAKGRKIHALVDSKGLPMRVVVHSAGIQDRDGAGLTLHKVRRRFLPSRSKRDRVESSGYWPGGSLSPLLDGGPGCLELPLCRWLQARRAAG
jgi:hypothetical protein